MTAPREPIERIRQALAAGPQVGETSTANAEFSAACSPDAIASLLSRLDELEKDAARLDYLESEFDREGAWLASDRSTRMPQTLFRSNLPITRAAIDSAIAKGA